ncbi:hypothetical protein T472_0205005 [Youngiibacter fragilis 232.1]|uniref:Uncharacterized protein n=1 Tax=Youngiibacter fragilis 232.1 TaxID=994573 RepID=V7IA69_9CLOT|nr:hypothetical protein T472_0205005 [Youngiibacter fragilis 232.1]
MVKSLPCKIVFIKCLSIFNYNIIVGEVEILGLRFGMYPEYESRE